MGDAIDATTVPKLHNTAEHQVSAAIWTGRMPKMQRNFER